MIPLNYTFLSEVSHFKCRTGKERESIWILISCQLHRVMSAWKGDKKQIRDRSTDSVSMKGRQKASQRHINSQCQRKRETESKSDRSIHSVSMKGRQKASQRQINSQCQHEREMESKSDRSIHSVSMKGRQKASQRQINSQCQHERKTESKSETDRQTQEWWTERQEHRERKGREKTKKNWKINPFFSNIAKIYVLILLSSGLQCWHSAGHSPPLKIIQLWRIHLASARNASVHPYSFFLMFCEGFNTGQQNQHMTDIKHNSVSVW